MAKFNFKEKGKVIAMTGAEIGVLGGSMILTKKFLDFEVLFKNAIAKDPAYKDKWYIKHQGGVKFGAGLIAASFISNPWLKMIALGVALEGFISEVRTVTTDKEGVAFFDKIGAASTDAELEQLARGAVQSRDYASTVAGPFDGATSVAGGFNYLDQSVDFKNPAIDFVAGVY